MPFTPRDMMPNSSVIRLLLAVASPLTLRAIERLLMGTPRIEVVGAAHNGRDALALLHATRPHLLLADEQLHGGDALELTREAMRAYPCPVVILCEAPASLSDSPARRAFLDAGALDFLARPNLANEWNTEASEAFVARLKMLARGPVIGRRPLSSQPVAPVAHATLPATTAKPFTSASTTRIIAIGASTGGPGALHTILSALPSTFPFSVVCVQHVSPSFLDGLVSWLDDASHLSVRLARDGELLRAGTVLFPPEDRHLEIGDGARVHLSDAPPCDGHKPSVTVLFRSLARSCGARTTAILLSGMGSDGASGLEDVHRAGGDTFAQNEATCAVFGMPRVAIERGAARHILPPEQIARHLLAINAG